MEVSLPELLLVGLLDELLDELPDELEVPPGVEAEPLLPDEEPVELLEDPGAVKLVELFELFELFVLFEPEIPELELLEVVPLGPEVLDEYEELPEEVPVPCEVFGSK